MNEVMDISSAPRPTYERARHQVADVAGAGGERPKPRGEGGFVSMDYLDLSQEVSEMLERFPTGVRTDPPSLLGHPLKDKSSENKTPVDDKNIHDPGALARTVAGAGQQTESEEEVSEDSNENLTSEEQEQVAELEQTDREVRSHEQAHLAAGGAYVRGGIQYDFQTGPDNKRYAVGGEVSIDTSKERTPEETIRKATVIQQAASAPADPSGQDVAVAAAASQMLIEAQQELAKNRADEREVQGDRGAESQSGLSPSFNSSPRSISGSEGVSSAPSAQYSDSQSVGSAGAGVASGLFDAYG